MEAKQGISDYSLFAVFEWLNLAIIFDVIKFVVLGIFVSVQKILRSFRTPKAKSLVGETILITGSANGLGKEICRELAASGATLVLWDIASEENARVAQELRDLGVKRVIEETVDVSNSESVKEAAFKLKHEVGPVTILINNAGVAPIKPFLQLQPEQIQKTFEINVLAQFWTLREFLPDMIRMNRGHVVTICSVLGLTPMRGSAPYVSSKHACHGFVESMKDELSYMGKCENIKFTTVYPFFIKTNMTEESTMGLTLKFKLDWLTPFLEVNVVAKRIVTAIQHEEEIVYAPDHFQLYFAALPFMSREVNKLFMDFIIKEFKYLQPKNMETKKSAMDRIDMELKKEVELTSKSF